MTPSKKVFVVDGGARGHAIWWALDKDPLVDVYCAPGNAGIPAECRRDVNLGDPAGIVRLAIDLGVGLVVIGPELPLTLGVVNMLANAGIPAVGPSMHAARLEGSKGFTKEQCERAGVPTAEYRIARNFEQARQIITQWGAPIVVKADGLCAGKGVVVAMTEAEALAAAHRMLVDLAFGTAGSTVVIERKLEGKELSVMALCDGMQAMLLPLARDHKRLLSGDQGPMTGGMGAYSPVPDVSEELLRVIKRRIFKPILRRMREIDCPFHGILYAGLMLTDEGPQVLEFNVRFGDPEVGVILPRIKSDLLPYLEGTTRLGGLSALPPLEVSPDAAVGVVMASRWYPEKRESGYPVFGIENAEAAGNGNVHVFHAGTRQELSGVCTAGGRVLLPVGMGPTLEDARYRVYGAVQTIGFEGAQYRDDVALNAP